jgi:hypothetical protein
MRRMTSLAVLACKASAALLASSNSNDHKRNL